MLEKQQQMGNEIKEVEEGVFKVSHEVRHVVTALEMIKNYNMPISLESLKFYICVMLLSPLPSVVWPALHHIPFKLYILCFFALE